MSKESIKIEFVRFMTPNNIPTCATNFETGEICRFLGSKSFGTKDVCMIDKVNIDREGSLGFTIPSKTCIMWSNKNN